MKDGHEDKAWLAIVPIYFVIVLWILAIVIAFLRIRAKAVDRQIHVEAAPDSGDRSTGKSHVDSTFRLVELQEHCFRNWHWRGRYVEEQLSFRLRLVFCIFTSGMTLVTIVWRVFKLGLLRGIAEQFTYLTQWGIMLSAIYYAAACAHYKARRGEASHLVAVKSRRMLVRLQSLALCFEVAIFIMWLAIALDANVHQHVLAPGAMVAEFLLNRVPLDFRDVPLLIFVLLAYLGVNFLTTEYWFVVYPGAITYKTFMTYLYVSITLAVAILVFVVCAYVRRTQLNRTSLDETDMNPRTWEDTLLESA